MHPARSGDRNVVGGDRHLPDRGLGYLRRGDRYTLDRWLGPQGQGSGGGAPPNLATGYSLTGPSSGNVSVASGAFTVALIPSGGSVTGPVTITPSDLVAGGVFTPSSVQLTTAAPSATFTYTPGLAGTRTISCNNDKGLTNPSGVTYTVIGGLNDGDPVSTWHDSSGNGHDASQTGSARPIFKAGIIGGKPVVRFTTAGHSGLNLASAISGDGPWTIFAVMKANGGPLNSLTTSGAVNWPCGPLEAFGPGAFYFASKASYGYIPVDYSAAWHVFTVGKSGVGSGDASIALIDGTSSATGGGTITSTGNFDTLGWNPPHPTPYSDGDLAEVIIYSGTVAIRAKLLLVLTVLISTGQIPSPAEADAMLAAGDLVGLETYLIANGVSPEQAEDVVTPIAVGDRANIEKYLGTKYGITVAGGTAVDPSTVAGLVGWWKADSLAAATGPPPFDPTTIAGLKGWWKADAITSSAGMLPALPGHPVAPELQSVPDGTLLTGWNDSSSNLNNLVVFGGTSIVYKTAIVNGKPVVRATAGSFELLNPIPTTSGWTVIAVWAGATLSSEMGTLGIPGTESPAAPTQSGSQLYVMANTTFYQDGAAFTGFHVYSGDSGPHLYVDGISKSVTTIAAPSEGTAFTFVGERGGVAGVNGDWAEILCYQGVLSTTDRQSVEAYLKAKYGL